MDKAQTWDLIHRERAAVADQLAGLAPSDWSNASMCGAWTVQQTAGHILAGAERTPAGFVVSLASHGFRFDTMMDREARAETLSPTEIIERLRARTGTTNRPPAPVMTMLGEVVVHGDDIRRPLGLAGDTKPEAIAACLEMYSRANFPVGTKKRIAGLHLVASDLDWSHGSGPEVRGPGMSLLAAITGRVPAVTDLDGDGVPTLTDRMPTAR